MPPALFCFSFQEGACVFALSWPQTVILLPMPFQVAGISPTLCPS
jgi:hypothetical protein